MYYTGIHPLTGEKVYVPKNPHEKAIQRALMQYKNPANRELVLEGLKMTGRMDLVGYGPKCLIRPLRENHGGQQHTQGSSRNAKNSRNSKNNKNSSASAKKNTIRNIHKKNSGGGRKWQKRKTEIKNKVKRKHLQEYPKGISDISEVKRDAAWSSLQFFLQYPYSSFYILVLF